MGYGHISRFTDFRDIKYAKYAKYPPFPQVKDFIYLFLSFEVSFLSIDNLLRALVLPSC